MNNAVHYEYVDTIVNRWLIESGALPVPAGDTVCIVVRSACVYHSALGFPLEIEAGLRADRIGRTSITYAIGLFAPGAASAAAEAEFTHVCVDRATMRPVPLPGRLRDALEALRTR